MLFSAGIEIQGFLNFPLNWISVPCLSSFTTLFTLFGAVVPESTAGSLKEIEPSEFFITSEDTAAGVVAVVPGAGTAAPVLPAVPLVVVEAPELVAGAVVAAMLAGAAGAAGLEAPVPAAGAVVAGSEAPVPATGVVVLAVDVEATPVAAGVTVPVSGASVLGAASVLIAAGLPVSSALTLKGVAAITPVTASAAT